MNIIVTCESCNTKFNVKQEHAWKKGKCPKCKNIIEIKNESIIKNDINKEDIEKKPKKTESRIWFAILLALAIGAFFIGGLSFQFYLLAWGAIFLFSYPLYKKYIKIDKD